VRDVVRDGINGRLLVPGDEGLFVDALRHIHAMDKTDRERLATAARETAQEFSMARTAGRALELYERLITRGSRDSHADDLWSIAKRRLGEEWKIWSNVAEAASHALFTR
jgi:hypothetical protein